MVNGHRVSRIRGVMGEHSKILVNDFRRLQQSWNCTPMCFPGLRLLSLLCIMLLPKQSTVVFGTKFFQLNQKITQMRLECLQVHVHIKHTVDECRNLSSC